MVRIKLTILRAVRTNRRRRCATKGVSVSEPEHRDIMWSIAGGTKERDRSVTYAQSISFSSLYNGFVFVAICGLLTLIPCLAMNSSSSPRHGASQLQHTTSLSKDSISDQGQKTEEERKVNMNNIVDNEAYIVRLG